MRGWPTIYIFDHKGVIRAKNKRGEEMDKVVDELLAELAKAGVADDKDNGKEKKGGD